MRETIDEASRTADTHRRRALWRALPAIVLVTLLVAAAAAFVVVRRVVDDQEGRILRERTGEVALVLKSAVGEVGSSMHSLAVAAAVRPQAPEAFTRLAREQAARSPGQTIRLVHRSARGFTVVDGAGPGLQKGVRLAGARLAVVRHALATGELASSPVFRIAGTRLIAFALGPPAAPAGSAIELETLLPRPSTGPVTDQQPFHELDAAFYAGPRARPSQLILATATDVPLSGRVARKIVPVGSSHWLLEARARDPLVGTFAHAVPWVTLGVGLLSALLATAAVLAMSRRRDYALALVDERTAELRASLDELERTQARLVLQERLAAIGELAAAVGHELRNPLGVVTNALYLLRSAVPPEQEARVGRHIETAEREVAAAATIVEGLLDFAREREPVTDAVDLPELIEEALTVAPAPPGVEVVRDGPGELPAILADRQQLRQVVLNLLTNAYEAMNGAGTLTIAARTRGRQLELRVSDTGAGMDEETRRHIFDPFFTRKAKGIGLGLAVTRRIVEAHGGAIAAESSPGQGATFSLTMPLAAQPQRVPS